MGAGGVGNNGAERLRYFKKVVAAPSLSRTGWVFDWEGLKEGNTWLALITFLYVDFFDCTGMPTDLTHEHTAMMTPHSGSSMQWDQASQQALQQLLSFVADG